MNEHLHAVLERSDQLELAIHSITEFNGAVQGVGATLALGQVAHSMELARAMRILLRQGLDAAAMALVRVQFESTTRALWLAGAATSEQIARYATPNADGALKGVNQGPSVDDMLRAIGRGPAAHIASALQLLKDATWRAMNHFSHASLVAVVQEVAPRQPEILARAVLNSNGMLLVATNVSLVVTAHRPTAVLRSLNTAFADCLPPVG